jgi:hypothetical protein
MFGVAATAAAAVVAVVVVGCFEFIRDMQWRFLDSFSGFEDLIFLITS